MQRNNKNKYDSFSFLLKFQCFINLNNLKWTENIQPSLLNDRSFRGTYSIQIKTAPHCVSWGNVGSAHI